MDVYATRRLEIKKKYLNPAVGKEITDGILHMESLKLLYFREKISNIGIQANTTTWQIFPNYVWRHSMNSTEEYSCDVHLSSCCTHTHTPKNDLFSGPLLSLTLRERERTWRKKVISLWFPKLFKGSKPISQSSKKLLKMVTTLKRLCQLSEIIAIILQKTFLILDLPGGHSAGTAHWLI